MDVLAFCMILVGLAAYVARPLYTAGVGTAPPDDRVALEARRDALLAALRDLEVDRASGLLDDAGHSRERAFLEAEAARVLERLDQPGD